MTNRSPEPLGGARYASVAVEGTLYQFDRPFDYRVPQALAASAQAGCRVTVPFGRGDRKRTGMILSVSAGAQREDVKELIAVLDQAPLLSHEMLLLAQWMQERYFCTLFDAVKLLLPAGIRFRVKTRVRLLEAGALAETEAQARVLACLERRKDGVEQEALLRAAQAAPGDLDALAARGAVRRESDCVRRIGDAQCKMLRCVPQEEPGRLTEKQAAAYEALREAGEISQKELCYYAGVSAAVAEALVKKGLAEAFSEEVMRNPYADAPCEAEQAPIHLSGAQKEALAGLLALCRGGEGGTALLYGVTGSGKTSVYLRLIDEVHALGRGVIVMVPEIALTPQTMALFHRRYGARVAVFHSGLSLGERLDEWKRVKNGEARIAVGTRSAVFAPFDDIGLIVMDEEQEYTYKSESSPHFHARDVARFRCAQHKAVLVLSSATPSLESRFAAQQGRYLLRVLPARFGGAALPEVTVADMNYERVCGNASLFSGVLMEALRGALDSGRQAILLLNRRGYNTFAVCRSCREVISCPHCSISLTYHAANNRLICHYCGYSIPFTDECPACHAHGLGYQGFGTQRAEEQLAALLPGARVLRIDTDAAMTRMAYEKRMRAFADGEYDILVGTQMVAKGLDFENVTVVGVLSADQALYSDDFRSAERAFALLTQVVGRSGRGRHPGVAVIQTFTPEHPVIRLAAEQNYEQFYRDELSFRRAMLYPPFADLCVVGFSGEDEALVASAAAAFLGRLEETAGEKYPKLPLRVLRPSPAMVARVRERYRYKLVVKCRNGVQFREMLRGLLQGFAKDRNFAGVTVFADINPDMVI